MSRNTDRSPRPAYAHAFDVRERRFNHSMVELRGADSSVSPPRIKGYAAKFGVRSANMGWGEIEFYEIIEPGFFDNVLHDDVRCLFNHNADLILGRTASRTCRIGQNSTGLWYDCDIDEEQSYTRDLAIALRRGDVNQSSFAFTVKRDGQRWVEDGNIIIRYLMKGGCKALYDVSPVTHPAYPAATSELVEAARRDGLLGRAAGSRSVAHSLEIERLHLDLDALEC